MAKAFTVKAVHEALEQCIRNRPDVGAAKALRDALLEPPNPFDENAHRPPQRWVVLTALLAALLLACLAYFGNFS